MSNLEDKLEQFRRLVAERAKRAGGEEAPKPAEKAAEPKPAEPAARAEPVSARISSPVSQSSGAASQVDRSAVLASPRPVPVQPAVSTAKTQQMDDDEDIPEVEDYLPWLKDGEGTGQPKVVERPSAPVAKPAAPVESTSAPVERPAAPAEPTAASAPAFSASAAPAVPAEGSTPRSFAPSTSVPSRDVKLPFEGTGEPRPLDRRFSGNEPDQMVEEKTETRAEAQPAPSPAVEAQPAVKAQVQPATRPAAASDQPARTMRVMLKHSALSPQPAVAPEVAEMWGKLPRHIQFLMGTQPQEVAQHSYKQFKETRDEMIQRLLDPSLSLEEAARILNVCPTTVRRYTNRGVLPHFRTVGNQRRFRLSDVLAFLETLSGHSGDGEELEA